MDIQPLLRHPTNSKQQVIVRLQSRHRFLPTFAAALAYTVYNYQLLTSLTIRLTTNKVQRLRLILNELLGHAARLLLCHIYNVAPRSPVDKERNSGTSTSSQLNSQGIPKYHNFCSSSPTKATQLRGSLFVI
jgi:hypothetical protein